jgi:hypothetical protein
MMALFAPQCGLICADTTPASKFIDQVISDMIQRKIETIAKRNEYGAI